MDSSLVRSLLQSLLTTNSSSLETVISNAPISSILDCLLQLEFKNSLSQYSSQDAKTAISSIDRELLLKLVLRLGEIKGIINLPRFALILASYGRTNQELMTGFAEKLLELDVGLFDLLQEQGPPLLVEAGGEATRNGLSQGLEEMEKMVAIQCALARSTELIRSVYGQDGTVLETLSTCYTLLNVSTLHLVEIPSSETIIKANLKMEIVETAHSILHAAFIEPLSDKSATSEEKAAFLEELETILKPLLDLSETGSTFFCDKSLLSDLEYYYKLSSQLQDGLGEKDAWRAKDLLRRLRISVAGEDGLELYLCPTKTITAEQDSDLSSSIKQILDVFPEQESEFIKTCLLHPRFAGNVASLLSALLEDDLPLELSKKTKKIPTAPTQTKSNERRNVFDDVTLDSTRLSRGKNLTTSTSLLSSSDFMTDSIKAAIIARAEEESSDDGEDGEAFLEDFDDGRAFFGVRDGEAEGEGEEERIMRPQIRPAPTDSPVNPINPALASLLNSIYLTSPDLFNTTSVVRRSKARIDLKAKTGLDDQQLEGWRIMLDRNPQKTKILSQHEIDFAGNHHPPPGTDSTSKMAESNSKEEPGKEGTNGKGGRGRGGGSNRGRGDGGKAAHQRRQRGNDRKMSKLG